MKKSFGLLQKQLTSNLCAAILYSDLKSLLFGLAVRKDGFGVAISNLRGRLFFIQFIRFLSVSSYPIEFMTEPKKI